MRFIKNILITIIILAGIGYGVYYFGTKVASEKLIEIVSNELVNSGEVENIKKAIDNDPELKAFINDANSIDESKLPFTTKEEATRVVVKKLGLSELKDIQSQVKQGKISRNELMQKVEKNFTEEEIQALKVIAYKELYGK
ncbi:hypothetical protein [Ornithinibacillus sp. JPR2-1]|uniref:hypothetical protein n=1 Tax=Ornithinibacillus sp. JPR2-1 TaxID=2094019 RepID=UPI0031DFDF5C